MSIIFLDLKTKKSWLPKVEAHLRAYKHLVESPVDLIINRIVTGQLLCANVNDELIALCSVTLSGNKSVFFIYYAFGNNMRSNLLEIVNYVKTDMHYDRLEFLCVSNAHARFYESIFNSIGKKLKKEYYFRCNLEEDYDG